MDTADASPAMVPRGAHSLTPCALPPMCSQRAKTKAVSKGDDPSAYRRLTIDCSHGAQLHQFGEAAIARSEPDNRNPQTIGSEQKYSSLAPTGNAQSLECCFPDSLSVLG